MSASRLWTWGIIHLNSSGWWYTYPSKKYEFVSWDYSYQYMEYIKCSKPPTSDWLIQVAIILLLNIANCGVPSGNQTSQWKITVHCKWRFVAGKIIRTKWGIFQRATFDDIGEYIKLMGPYGGVSRLGEGITISKYSACQEYWLPRPFLNQFALLIYFWYCSSVGYRWTSHLARSYGTSNDKSQGNWAL